MSQYTMLPLFLRSGKSWMQPTVVKKSLTRSFSISGIRCQNQEELIGKGETNDTDTKPTSKKSARPLSRIPLGVDSANGQNLATKGGTIEFTTWKAAALFVGVGSIMYYLFSREKKRLQVERDAESNRGYGRPAVRGPFELLDFNGNQFTEKNLLGKFSLIYFGFSRCPDICPAELDKLSAWLDGLSKSGIEVQPIFITCDPARDSPDILKEYLAEFHPDIIGLTGTYEQVKNACKQYRVYFSTPPNVKPGQDYLVDHSIFFYLIDPEGKFVDVLGRQYDEDTGKEKIIEHIKVFVPEVERLKRKEKWYSFLFN